jgi:hypothetical protein
MTSDPQSLSILAATAVRLAYGIGLHRTLDEFGLSQLEKDQRRNVFWTVYIIDKNIALRCGQPSAIVDDDIGIDLPRERNIIERYPDGTRKFELFRCQAQLALLESRIYTELYSIRSRTRSDLDRLMSVSKLDSDLQKWRESLPEEICPEMPIKCSKDQLFPVLMMHFAYFNCVTTVHRVSIHHGSWTSDLANRSGSNLHNQHLNPRVYASQSRCLAMARNTIQLLQMDTIHRDGSKDNFIWCVLSLILCPFPATIHYFLGGVHVTFGTRLSKSKIMILTSKHIRMAINYQLSSFLTLFANTLQNPRDSCVASDLKLMNFVTTLQNSTVQVSSFSAKASLKMFNELGKVALKFVEETHKGTVKKPKQGYERHDSERNNMRLREGAKPVDPLFYSNTDPTTSGSQVCFFFSLSDQATCLYLHRLFNPIFNRPAHTI